jgi:predicted unusual protein kinase regulating ubiquinone biosynthesis (AarF/ABC1/UbiB family)
MQLKDAPPKRSNANAVATEVLPSTQPLPTRRARVSHGEPDWLRYDPAAIGSYYQARLLRVFWRFLSIFVPICWFVLRVWWDSRTGKTPQKQQKRAIQFRQLLTNLGPAYIKIGQALSTRPDLVPPFYMDELTKLQDKIPPFSNEIAFKFIEEELGDRPESIYASISDMPIAAASLGQVYRGRLYSGETVAIKVQRPGLVEKIAMDLYVMRSLATWAQAKFVKIRSDLVSIVDEFASRIFEEMDYENEGRNAERFADLYGYIPEIYIPKIHWQYTARRVLTMEWIEGTKLTDIEEVKAKGVDAKHLVNVGVQCSLRQLLEHGFFHADPHPGNLLATTDGKLAYLDFGMMSQVKPYQRYGLIEAVVHLVNRDYEGLTRDYVKLEFLTPDTDLTPIMPALAEVFNTAFEAGGNSVADLDFKSVTDRLSGVMYEFPFRVPAYYALIVRSLVTLEGIATTIDPDFKVLSEAYPYVAKRLLTDSSDDLRNSLKELLFKDGSFRWNRLENLLKNAKNNEEYDLANSIDGAIDYLTSERGEFLRDYLADEIVRGLDDFGQETLNRATRSFRQTFGLPVGSNGSKNSPTSLSPGLENMQRLWGILQDTPGFDPLLILPKIPEILVKSEVQSFGQKIASRLAGRIAARFIREVLLQDVPAGLDDRPTSVKALPTRK